MANSDPWRGRLGRSRKRLAKLKASDLEQASVALTAIIEDCMDRVAGSPSPDDVEFCRLAGTLIKAVSAHMQIHELGEIENRLAALEKAYSTNGRMRYNLA